MNLLELSQNIRKIRIEQEMTVEQLARDSGFSKGFISQVENFRLTPSLKALTRIADALGVSMSMLFAEDGDTSSQYTFGNLSDGRELEPPRLRGSSNSMIRKSSSFCWKVN